MINYISLHRYLSQPSQQAPSLHSQPVKSTPTFFENSVKNRATFQRPATHARNIVYAYD